MLHIVRKINSNNVDEPLLPIYLNEKFQTGYISPYEMEKINEWGEGLKQTCPDNLEDSLIHIASSSNSYFIQNHISKTSLLYTWPLFFEKFPKGQIWLVEISERWTTEIKSGQRSLAEKYNIDREKIQHPQSNSGITVDTFPFTSFDFLSYGIYPFILFEYASTFSGLTFIYIPDINLKHSQMTEGSTHYQHILWSFHHIFDDQWTFDSSRGPKSSFNAKWLNPIDNVEYFDWFINKMNGRMNDIMDVSNPFKREKLGMTFNRAIYDALLCVTSELPYMSKIFFFNCLDKLSNLMIQLNFKDNEAEAWELLVDEDFVNNEVVSCLENIPNNAGEYINAVLSNALEELKYGDILPKDLHDIRNSHHGYELRTNIIKRLMSKSGEFNNNITLIVVPLIIYFFSIKWDMK